MKTRKDKKKFPTAKKPCMVVKKHLAFAVGDEVLACWQDGLYYLAVVKSIDEEKSKCHVSFQDGSFYWISFKHIRTTPQYDDISCIICGGKESNDHNEIIICDRCNHGYHQACHMPNIDDQCIKEPSTWFCRVCVFSNAAKSGGAIKSGVEGDALLSMKQVLPYDIGSLKWDAHHKTNTSETYCYCGGPGLWYYKMMECYNCNQWFHEACLQCLDFPLLLGDRFYYFLCTMCNKGKEYLKRIQLRWPDIVTLVLYNMSLKYDKKGFSQQEIKIFIENNWDDLQTGDLHTTLLEDRMEKILDVFAHQKKKFRSYTTGGTIFWSLIVRSAPRPTKPSYFREHCLKIKSETGYGFIDCNGNYLPEIQGNSRKSLQSRGLSNRTRVCTQARGATDDNEITNSQAPLFPSPSMFKYFLPRSARRDLERGNSLSSAFSSGVHGARKDSDGRPRPGEKRGRVREDGPDLNEPIEKHFLDYVQRLGNGITSYEGSLGRLACGEQCTIRGRRLASDGRAEYLVEWAGTTPNDC